MSVCSTVKGHINCITIGLSKPYAGVKYSDSHKSYIPLVCDFNCNIVVTHSCNKIAMGDMTELPNHKMSSTI